ncbi:MAG TPA: polymer-forming cytoskeletal protein [Candidatus Aminicenantes bacterium]|nr:polymer-forming cytoskeletal protein [Candidatus Aminicenantes bacterium]
MARNENFVRMSGFIDKDTEFNGELRFSDSLRIDGILKGKVTSGQNLIIGESGDVDADIVVRNISINGRVKGNVIAKERAEIFANGRFSGKLVTPKLVIEEGAFFQGSCQMELKVLESSNQQVVSKSTEEKGKKEL